MSPLTTLRGLFRASLLLLCAGAARAHEEDAEPAPHERSDTKISAVPFVGFETERGVGVGALGAIEHYALGMKPYEWRLEASGSATFKPGEARVLDLPYQEASLQLSWMVSPKLQLQMRGSYVKETALRYSGIGNAAPEPSAENSPTGDEQYYSWDWIRPLLSFGARATLGGPLYLFVRVGYRQNWITLPEQSKLRDDAASEPELIRGLDSYAVFSHDYALQFDTRDSEVDPRSGHFHALTLRYSPADTYFAPYRYGQGNLSLRFYVTPIDPYLTIGLRTAVDMLFGEPPFYELARVDDTYAFGGSRIVRGVPRQRYYGMIKLFTNLELRSRLLPVHVFGKECLLGAALFFDGGRLWAEYEHRPDLDGTGIGLKYGIGGGPRIVVGDVLILRGDVAWSPDAHPVSGYFIAGHAF